jgi:hypothetical protein
VITLREGGRAIRIAQLSARRETVGETEGSVVLGRGRESVLARGLVRVPLSPKESRIVVGEAVRLEVVSAQPDLFFGPEGLRLPGEEPMAPTAFLKKHFRGGPGHPNRVALLLRKFLRLSPPPAVDWGVHLPRDGEQVFSVWRTGP